jgi:hypothetical protein
MIKKKQTGKSKFQRRIHEIQGTGTLASFQSPIMETRTQKEFQFPL